VRRVNVDLADYQARHGCNPSGYGLWLFRILGGHVEVYLGSYGDARRAASREARAAGVARIVLLFGAPKGRSGRLALRVRRAMAGGPCLQPLNESERRALRLVRRVEHELHLARVLAAMRCAA
jgi:hypothetical protein